MGGGGGVGGFYYLDPVRGSNAMEGTLDYNDLLEFKSRD